MTLSPLTVTRAGTGFRFGKWKAQPLESAVATNSYFTSVLSPFSFIVFICHFPATSASEMVGAGAGGGGAAAVVAAESAMVPLACCWSGLEQPTSTAAQQPATR